MYKAMATRVYATEKGLDDPVNPSANVRSIAFHVIVSIS